jgi:riboflavin kinase/FMN adenylyltransferase
MGGETVSSTLIRTAVESGDFPKASRLLGREYTILGDVVTGQRLGSELGFPTANLQAHSELFPPDGVYAVEALVEGEQRKGVANIGLRPTVEQAGTRRLEVHLFDFDGDLYGAEMEVSFRHFLRGEKRFANIAELRAQIVQDCATARSALVG